MLGWFAKPGPPSIRRIGPEFGKDCAKIHAVSFAHAWGAAEFESLLAGRDVIAPDIAFVARLGLLADPKEALPTPQYLKAPDVKPPDAGQVALAPA